MQNQSFHLKIGDGRRIVLPADVCNGLHVGIGDTIIVALENDHATLRSIDASVEWFQRLVAQQTPTEISLVDELIRERREDALRE